MIEKPLRISPPAYKLFGRLSIVLASGLPFFSGLLIAINYHRTGQEMSRDKSIILTSLVFVISMINVIKNDFELDFIFIACYLLQAEIAFLCFCNLQGNIIDMHVSRGGALAPIHHTLAYNILFSLFFFTIAFLIKQVCS